MSASQALAIDAIAFQLAAALEDYESRVGALVASWPDLQGYADANDRMEKIRLYTASLPGLRVQWVEVLITHAELVHHLWRTRSGLAEADASHLGPALDQHLGAVVALRQRCSRLMVRADRDTLRN